MDASAYDDFRAFFRAEILPIIITHVEAALDHLRRNDQQQWLRIAMELRQRGPYDRIEKMQERTEAFTGLIETLAEGLTTSVPEFVRLHTLTLERHFVQHGLELDDLLRTSPNTEPMSASESVEAQLRAMGYKVNPKDAR